MRFQQQSTFRVSQRDIERKWFVVDADGLTLGRLASRIAPILKGKHKPMFEPHLDVGDYVIVINCEKIWVTGNRLDTKRYYRHTGYPGGLYSKTLRQVLAATPERVIHKAVQGMLPKGALGKQMLRKLKVYKGSEHPHEAQKPEVLEIKMRR